MSSRAVAAPRLRRSLTNRHIQLIAIGGAIGTGLFLGSGRTVATAGPSSLLVYAIVGAVLFLFMRAMGELLLSDERYGTFADVATDLLGPAAGLFVGWTYWLAWIVTGVADMVAMVGYVRFWWPGAPQAVVVGVLVGAMFAINAATVRAFGEAESALATVKITAILCLVGVAAWFVATGHRQQGGAVASVSNLWTNGGFFPHGAAGFAAAFQVAIFAFVGIELVGTTAGEAADPRRALPRAVDAVPVRVLLFYLGALAAIMCVVPWDQVDPGRSPFVELFAQAGLGAAASVVNFVVLTAALSSANSGIYSTSRMLFGLAREGSAPARFGRLSARGVPLRALVVSCLCLLSAAVVMAFGGSVVDAFTSVTTVSALLFLAVWSTILVCYLRYARRAGARRCSVFPMPGGRAAVCAVLAAMGAGAALLVAEPGTRVGALAGLAWFAAIGAVCARRRSRARVAADGGVRPGNRVRVGWDACHGNPPLRVERGAQGPRP